MERLTYFVNTDFDDGEYRVNENGSEYTGPSIERLAQYENTGADPEDISSRQKEIVKAEKEGRLVILPEPCEDIDWFHLIKLLMYDSQDRLIWLPKLTDKERESVHDFLWDCFHGFARNKKYYSKLGENEREALNCILNSLLLKEERNAD